jgi:hypothetical protein
MDRRPDSKAASGVASTSAVAKGRRFVPEDQPIRNFSRAAT